MASAHARDILLVEDDEADAFLIQDALQDQGAPRNVVQAVDGIAALQHLRTLGTPHPDLIVLDLNMPRMNGHEFLDVLKNDDALRTIPVVVLSTSSTPGDIETAYGRHANAYVTKPVALDDFMNAVHSIDAFFLRTVSTPPRAA
ncbi:response regulator [Streptacidiphilus sp. PB12-B1b]|uniref:response regulator n=1 Tax=Streptacidiphilus sp. PB12-B1b TaxID=2705012 RepID=UPI0015FA35D7|nr:response regulator [Streptacidiphilus sp. PB12-B1b]